MLKILWSVLLSVLLFGSSACAFADDSSAVWDYLSHSGEELFQEKAYFENVNVESACNGMNAQIDDAIWKDDELHIGFRFDVTEPVYVIMDEIKINGQAYEISTSSFVGQWLCATEGKEPVTSQGISIPIQMTSDRRFDISICISFLSTKDGVQHIDRSKLSNAMIWKAIDEAVAQGKTPVEQDEPNQVLVSSAWFESDFEEDMNVSYPLNDSEALVDYSNMSIVSTLKEVFCISW